MHTTVTLRQAGGSVTATIPRHMAERHKLGPGDKVFVVETPQGILLTPYDPALAEQLAAYREVVRENRDTLAALSKL
jgi:antitoxin component of MazEF toxin-antitoxin module